MTKKDIQKHILQTLTFGIFLLFALTFVSAADMNQNQNEMMNQQNYGQSGMFDQSGMYGQSGMMPNCCPCPAMQSQMPYMLNCQCMPSSGGYGGAAPYGPDYGSASQSGNINPSPYSPSTNQNPYQNINPDMDRSQNVNPENADYGQASDFNSNTEQTQSYELAKGNRTRNFTTQDEIQTDKINKDELAKHNRRNKTRNAPL